MLHVFHESGRNGIHNSRLTQVWFSFSVFMFCFGTEALLISEPLIWKQMPEDMVSLKLFILKSSSLINTFSHFNTKCHFFLTFAKNVFKHTT